MPVPRNPDREREIVKLYVEDGLGTVTIGKRFGLTKEAIRLTLIKQGIQRRPADWTCAEINRRRTA